MRSDLAGWAQYGCCASHSRYFWRLRLHLVCTLSGLPVAFALAGAKAGDQETLLDSNPSIRPLKGQLDLERHGGHTCNGVAIRVQRILALAAVIRHNEKTGAPV